MVVMVELRGDRDGGEPMSWLDLAVVGQRQGRAAVLARLDDDEFSHEALEGDPISIDWRLTKLEVAPGLFAPQVVVREEERDDSIRTVTEQAMAYAVEGSELFQVLDYTLSSVETDQDRDEGQLHTFETASRTRVKAIPGPAGSLYRLQLEVRETEQEDGQLTTDERERVLMCFEDGAYEECEPDGQAGTVGP